MMRVLISMMVTATLCATGCSSEEDTGGTGFEGEACDPGNPFGNACDGNSGSESGSEDGRGSEDGSGNGTGTGGSAGSSDDSACPSGRAFASRISPTVNLLLDGSCSMSTDYPNPNNESATVCSSNAQSRWTALREALVGNGGVVPRLEGVVHFGLNIFGTVPSCPFAGERIDPALDQAGTIINAFPQAPPGQFTPTGAALRQVVQDMPDETEVLDNDLGAQIIVLATDGEPNSCNSADTDFQPPVDAANAARDKGITVYVVSLANASGQFADHLQQLANIGQDTDNATVYTPNNPEELTRDLELLIGGAVTCDVSLNGTVIPGRECEGTVRLDGNDLECGAEWEMPDQSTIRLLGESCDLFKNNASSLVEADWPCNVFTVD